MSSPDTKSGVDSLQIGEEMHRWMAEAFPHMPEHYRKRRAEDSTADPETDSFDHQ